MGKKDSENIKIVTDNGNSLNISEVKKHLDIQKPKQKESKKNIVIPSEKNSKN